MRTQQAQSGCAVSCIKSFCRQTWLMTACLDAEHHAVILELLEIPQLMSACVRSGSYDEALDLRAFAAKTALLHPNLEVNTLHVEPPGPGHRHVLHPQLALKRYRSESTTGNAVSYYNTLLAVPST